uniref:Ty3 transposon capsid-like protein domain-containing protein n=1 Tax=Ananas comosus var. bracteatus TaxID=296719 RepID=A0A6V7P4R0_ANACO|nr:unnamed protein product [Ananas comosus var. bracteatus]
MAITLGVGLENFHGYLSEKGVVNWESFAQDICKRFDSNGLKDVVEEFNKLAQHGIVEDYQEQFEDLRSRLLNTNSQFAPEYFLSSFLSGLKEEISTTVKMMRPSSLTQAFELAKLQEQNLKAVMRTSKMWFKSQGSTLANSGPRATVRQHHPGERTLPGTMPAKELLIDLHRIGNSLSKGERRGCVLSAAAST